MTLATNLFGFTLIVPDSEDSLAQAELVAVATLSKEGDSWQLTLKEVLKGEHHPGDVIPLYTDLPAQAFKFEILSRLVGNEDFLFVGKYSPTKDSAHPCYGIASAWPQGRRPESLPQRTLAECLTLAKEVLKIPRGQSSEQSPPAPPPTPAETEHVKTTQPSDAESAQQTIPLKPTDDSEIITPRKWLLWTSAVLVGVAVVAFFIKRRSED